MKNKKRMIVISGMIIMLCIIEFIIGNYCSSRANARVSYKIRQDDITEAEIARQATTEAASDDSSSEEETDEITSDEQPQTIFTAAESQVTHLEPVRAPYIGPGYAITCWGDSLTEGTGSWGGATMPSMLESLTDMKTYNMGVFGEDSRSIACRQGGLKMYVDNITIPPSGSVRFDEILCEDGNPLELWMNPGESDAYGLTACFDNCSIAGIAGKLTYDYSSDEYIFTRAEDEKPPEPETQEETTTAEETTTETETATTVNNTKKIQTKVNEAQSKKIEVSKGLEITSPTEIILPVSDERRNDISVLQMGNNGGYDDDYSVLISQYQAMIDYSGNGYYIIVGDTDYDEWYRADWENALQNAFGDHFFNMRAYLVDLAAKGGLDEYGIELTQDDFDCIDRGEVPYSLKIGDESHLNATGYEIEGKAIYEKGLELGYWTE